MYKRLQQQYVHVILRNWLNAISQIVIWNACIISYTIECEDNDNDNNKNDNNSNKNSKSNNIKKNENDNEMNNNKNNINNANKKSWREKSYT